MHKFSNTLVKYISYFIFILSGIFIFYLFLLSIFSTSHISPFSHGSMEYTYYTADNAFLHIGLIIIFSILCMLGLHIFLHSRRAKLRRILSWLARLMPFITAICAAAWVLYTRNVPFPIADQGTVLSIAEQMRDKNFASFYPGEYMDMYHNQFGIVMFMYLLSYIVGDYNYTAFQLLNAASLGVIVFFVRKMALIISDSEITADICCICTALFAPLFLYTTFVYGTLIGLALTTASFCLLLNYIKHKKTSNLAIAVPLIVLSVFMKSNYLIALIAFLIVLMLDVIKVLKKSAVICLLITLPIYLLCSALLTTAYKSLTKMPISDGMPASVHIAMGLSEAENAAPGWYNDSFVSAFRDNGGDSGYAGSVAGSFIKERIKFFVKNPAPALSFFSRKMASGWNNPTFQSFWLYRRNSIVSDEFIHHSTFTDTLLGLSGHESVYRFIIKLLDAVHTLILFGVMMYILFCFKKSGTGSGYALVLLPLFFVGGFLFHGFWEMKAQYTLPYFVLLLPVSVIGFRAFIEDLYTTIMDFKDKKRKHILSTASIALIVILIAAVLIYVLPLSFNNELFKLSENSYLFSTSEL